MAKPVNLIRNTNAILKPKDITTFGKRWAVQDGADGYPMVNVTVTDTTQDVKMYLEGSNEITVYPVASDVSKLCKSALTSFPNINTIFLFSATKVNIEEETQGLGDYLSYLSLLSKIYVPSALLNSYQSTYTSLSSKFDIIVEDLTITIEWVGNNNLTSEEITRQLNTLESAYLNQATKLVIDDRYTDYLDTLWAYNFTEKCLYLNNNIWHGTLKVDLTQKTLTGVDELLESDIDNFIASISDDKKSGVTQLHFEGFSDMSVALQYNYEDLPNLEYVWLDNVRYDVNDLVAGYTRVEYLQGDGNAYIDSETIFKTTDILELVTMRTTTSNLGDNGSLLIGVYSGSLTSQFMGGYCFTNDFYLNIITITGGSPLIKHTLEYKQDENNQLFWYINGEKKTTRIQTADTTLNYWIFARNFNGNPNAISKERIYFIKHKNENGNYVRNFIPVIKNGEYFLYDNANKVEYHNIGTGAFTGGSVYYPATYFYSLSNLETEYNANLNQTFYLDYNGTLPSYPNYQLTYYTDINCTTSILPENMQSGTRYYVKAVMVTLVIQGSGTLTSAIVENAVSKAGSGVTKVVMPNTFTSIDNGALDSINTNLTNCDTLIMQNTFAISYYSFIKNIIIDTDSFVTNFMQDDWGGVSKIYLPKITGSNSLNRNVNWYGKNIFVNSSNATGNGLFNGQWRVSNIYIPALSTVYYETNWKVRVNNIIIGVLDGNNVYTDKGFTYPKLSSTLTIDTTNGHLMDNGVDLFDGYTATWYSDENCTITIQPSAITNDMTVYVKLTAI